MKRTKLFGLLIIIFLVLAFYGGLTVNPASAAVRLEFGENQMTSNNATQKNPDIYEYGLNNYAIVWEDDRNGNWDVYMYYQEYLGDGNWDVRPEVRITTSSANEQNPRISNDIIVYQSDRNGNWDIYMYNLTSKVETQITNNTAQQTNPAVDGNYIVWQDSRRGPLDIYLYDLTTHSERQVTSTDNNFNAEISGDRIVYVCESSDTGTYGQILKSEILWCSISSGATRMVDFEARGNVADPAIDGNTIAYCAHPLNEWDVFLYNASTNANFWFTTGDAQNRQPDVSGRYVVDVDDRNGNLEIYITDTVVGQEFRVTNNSATQNLPKISAVYGGFIVYNDNRNGNWDIYLTSFYSTTLTTATGPNTSSTHSSTVDLDNPVMTVLTIATAVIIIAIILGASIFMAQRKKRARSKSLIAIEKIDTIN